MDTNVLYYGDNLEILRKYIPDETIDLIYLDPPFNSMPLITFCSKSQVARRLKLRYLPLRIRGTGG